MYKDDKSSVGSCNQELLRMVLGGAPNQGTDTPCFGGCNQSNQAQNNASHIPLGLEGYPLASVYAPLQSFENLYDEKTALKQGTLFSELDLPFGGTTIQKGGNCRG